MLSVSESAQILGVSPARVRQLIADGSLEATKIGKSWVLPEAAVYDRASKHCGSGRPSSSVKNDPSNSDEHHASEESASLTRIYEQCKEMFQFCPSADVLMSAKSQEEADFYMNVADFFLRQRQRELVKRGVF